MLKSVAMNVSCLAAINTIDLSRNHFHQLDEDFRRNFANYLPPQSLAMRNLFHCDCHSKEWIAWIRSTNTIREKTMLTCSRSSPLMYVGSRLVEVPVHNLDCSVPMDASGSVVTQCSSALPFLLFLFFRAAGG